MYLFIPLIFHSLSLLLPAPLQPVLFISSHPLSSPLIPLSGRLKGPEYVSLTTRVYRQAVDAAWEALTRHESPNGDNAVRQGEGSLQSAKKAVKLQDRMLWDLEQVGGDQEGDDEPTGKIAFRTGKSHTIAGVLSRPRSRSPGPYARIPRGRPSPAPGAWPRPAPPGGAARDCRGPPGVRRTGRADAQGACQEGGRDRV